MRHWPTLLLIPVLWACTATYSTKPLSPPDEAKLDDRLVGVWRVQADDQSTFVHAIPNFGGWLDVVAVSHGQNTIETLHMRVFATVDADARYLNVLPIEDGKEHDRYLLVRYRVVADGELELMPPDGDAMKKLLEEKKITGTFTASQGGGEVVLDDAPEAIRALFREHAKALFVEPTRLVRMAR